MKYVHRGSLLKPFFGQGYYIYREIYMLTEELPLGLLEDATPSLIFILNRVRTVRFVSSSKVGVR